MFFMQKTATTSSKTHMVAGQGAATKVVRNKETGQSVTVKGVGALKGSDLKIKKSVSLLKPIAEQALNRRPKTSSSG